MSEPPGLATTDSLSVAWVSTRKARHIARSLAPEVDACYFLHELLGSVKLPLDELSQTHLVVVEVPPSTLRDFEHHLAMLVAKIRAAGPHVALITQPSLRKQTQKMTWISKWNRQKNRPFDIKQTCVRTR